MELREAWWVHRTTAGEYQTPDWLDSASDSPLPATVPGTVSQLLFDSTPQPYDNLSDLDQSDWWYHCNFALDDISAPQTFLVFDGLATLAEVWLNGERILSTDNMFRQYRVDVTSFIQSQNTLAICFRSLAQALKERRPRPRWKTKLIEHQQLRWFRTTLLGYIPGWAPPLKAIGPWRAIYLEQAEIAHLAEWDIQTRVEGSRGLIGLQAGVNVYDQKSCTLTLDVADKKHILFDGKPKASNLHVEREISLDGIELWWPHTHGDPRLYPYTLTLQSGDRQVTLKTGTIGFRNIELDNSDDKFQLRLNGQPVFARGASWTVNDIISLTGNSDDLRSALELARQAGMNMLRLSGTMLYEQDEFYTLCDELGIMVWQDFMFANMDYPVDDPDFHGNILAEAVGQLKRLQPHPSVVVYCGSSEVEQQAAMLGMPAELWRNDWFATELPHLVGTYHHGTVYVPSTPSGGALPFHTNRGVAHYYGVGAYLRDLSDVRRADVKFATECLAFANIPDDETIRSVMGDLLPMPHHPRWKSRVPRDNGSGWDFEDVRDHYLGELFDVDPVRLRSTDTPRYLRLSGLASGEIMSQVYSEWRSVHSCCGGALVWFYNDLWPGAGWGVLDSDGRPKAAYYYLKRVLQPICLLITDEGLQGLDLHVINERSMDFGGTLEFCMLRDGDVTVARASREIHLGPREKACFSADELLGDFYDVSYAYRFGPAHHELSCATLRDRDGQIVSQQFHFPQGHTLPMARAQVEARATQMPEGGYQLSVQSDRFLYGVHLDCDGYRPGDNEFHLMPGQLRSITLFPTSDSSGKLRAYLSAANLRDEISIPVES
jgi:beta-mannosidase